MAQGCLEILTVSNNFKLNTNEGRKPMSKKNTKSDVIRNKKYSIKLLNNLLEKYITDESTLRKADLMSKWIVDYVRYIDFEGTFDPRKNISYSRGDIVKVNFGFNIGSELGGVHYAVVIDNKNNQSSDSITVVPMSSIKEDTVIKTYDLNIGNEFYNIMNAKYNNLLKEHTTHRDELTQILTEIRDLIFNASCENDDLESSSTPENTTDITIGSLTKKIEKMNDEIDILKKNKAEIDLMKTGSLLKPCQIRTISKIRIWYPKTPRDPLYGVKLSDATMDKLTKKLIEYFIK